MKIKKFNESKTTKMNVELNFSESDREYLIDSFNVMYEDEEDAKIFGMNEKEISYMLNEDEFFIFYINELLIKFFQSGDKYGRFLNFSAREYSNFGLDDGEMLLICEKTRDKYYKKYPERKEAKKFGF